MGRRLGLVIGINSYQDDAFQPLRYAETDARAIAQWLVNTQGGKWAPADVQLVQGAYATRELVETLITQLCVNVAVPGDSILVYFAGHSFLDTANGDGYLALANTRHQQPATGIHLPTLIQQTMARSRADHIVFMFDYFQTGQVWSKLRLTPYDNRPLIGPNILNALQQTGNRLILCSCRGNEFAPETGEKNLGVFTHRMILGLCGPASDPATRKITLQRLHSFLFNSLGEQQRPQLFGQEITPLVLVGDMPATPLAIQQSGQLPHIQSGQLPAASFSPGVSQSQPLQAATATIQMSPTTSGQFSLSAVAEQQSEILLRQARQLIQLQNPTEALKYVEQALVIAPTNISALILKGQLLGTGGHFQAALNTVEQLLRIDSNHALGWSMRAALLSNMGQYQMALQAVERSLELDPNDPETYSVKTSIMGQIAAHQNKSNSKKLVVPTLNKRDAGPASISSALVIQFLGLVLGIAGIGLPILQPRLPVLLAFVLQSLGLAILCVHAARGSYLYGFSRFFLTFITSVIVAAILGLGVFLGGVNKIGTGRVYTLILHNPPALLFLGLWLAASAAIPLLLALFALIAGLIFGVRRKK
ncbi:MAG TPA: tetratricopeptide repeat protein [Ktedonobacteraceae bacterium]|nr:tetratricopeptide repeat protein [Ktedonobacteraceae bacterium]